MEVVAEARSGREAVQLAQGKNPDLVIMDISMPDLNGMEATSQMIKVVIHLKGNLDGSGACQVESALERLQDLPGNCKLIFNLRGVRSFEYFGVAILAKSIRRQKNNFQHVSLIGLQLSVESVFRHFGLESTLNPNYS